MSGMPRTNGKSVTVDDEENQSQNATIRRIQRYRDNLAEYQMLFAQQELEQHGRRRQAHKSYHQLVKGFAQLLSPYLTDREIECAEEYWQLKEFGSWEVAPPDAISQPSRRQVQDALGSGRTDILARADPRNQLEPYQYRVQGVEDFVAAPPEWEVSWSMMVGPEVSPRDLRSQMSSPDITIDARQHRTDPITVHRRVRVPRDVIGSVVRGLEMFIREIGMDVDMTAPDYTGGEEPGL